MPQTTNPIPKVLTAVCLLFFLIGGCASVISPEAVRRAEPAVPFEELLRDPEAYRGRAVILAGVILESLNTREGTLLTVLQKPGPYGGRPENTDETGGRFLLLHPEYLDVAVYAPGRELTVAGEVLGRRLKALGEIEYAYPLVRAGEIHLWGPRPRTSIGFELSTHPFHDSPFWWGY